MARALKTRAVKSGSKEKTKKTAKKQPVKKLVMASKAKAPAKKAAAIAPQPKPAEKKNVSQRLLEAIARRKREKASEESDMPVKKPGRRGRRPKNVEYNPENKEEDQYVYEAENERLEYDTGIRAKDHADEGIGGLERVEDFDEELNFDW